MDVPAESPVRLNIGAGQKREEGWISVGLEEHHDVRTDVRKLPLPDDYADEAMAIHVLEHLNRWEAEPTLAEWRRVLKPGARLVLELPELHKCCRAVLEGFAGYEGVPGLFGDPATRDELMMHRWCWSENELRQALLDAGFRKVRTGPLQYHGRKRWRDMHMEAVK